MWVPAFRCAHRSGVPAGFGYPSVETQNFASLSTPYNKSSSIDGMDTAVLIAEPTLLKNS